MKINLYLTEAKIARVHRSRFGFLNITLQIKPEDYTVENRAILEEAADEGEVVMLALDNVGLTEEPEKKTGLSIFQEFKFFCENMGKDYEAEKKRMGVAHLRELLTTMSDAEAENMLRDRMFEIKNEIGLFNHEL